MSRPFEPLGSRRPLPVQISEQLRARIAAGEYPPGSRLPSEAELSAGFGVSRVTVREALRMLQRDGLAAARQGKGHYVLSGSPIREPVTELRSVTELLGSLGYEVETEVLAVERLAAGDLAERLQLSPGEQVTRVERLRSSGGEPLIYSIDTVPSQVLGDDAPDFRGSLIALLAERGFELAYSHARIHAATLPTALAGRIRAPAGSPWLLLEQVNYDAGDRPLILSSDYHRGDRFEFNVVRRRIDG